MSVANSFQDNRPDWPKYSAEEKKGPFVNMIFYSCFYQNKANI
jgi:hypothetical protein